MGNMVTQNPLNIARIQRSDYGPDYRQFQTQNTHFYPKYEIELEKAADLPEHHFPLRRNLESFLQGKFPLSKVELKEAEHLLGEKGYNAYIDGRLFPLRVANTESGATKIKLEVIREGLAKDEIQLLMKEYAARAILDEYVNHLTQVAKVSLGQDNQFALNL